MTVGPALRSEGRYAGVFCVDRMDMGADRMDMGADRVRGFGDRPVNLDEKSSSSGGRSDMWRWPSPGQLWLGGQCCRDLLYILYPAFGRLVAPSDDCLD